MCSRTNLASAFPNLNYRPLSFIWSEEGRSARLTRSSPNKPVVVGCIELSWHVR
jgi:hypothetical protein